MFFIIRIAGNRPIPNFPISRFLRNYTNHLKCQVCMISISSGLSKPFNKTIPQGRRRNCVGIKKNEVLTLYAQPLARFVAILPCLLYRHQWHLAFCDGGQTRRKFQKHAIPSAYLKCALHCVTRFYFGN